MAVDAVDIWGFRPTAGYVPGADLVGYRVEATDGHIGKVDRLSARVGAAHLAVDTGPWIFGKHVLLPAGTVVRIDPAGERVFVDRTKDEIKAAPEFDPAAHDETDSGLQDRFTLYYDPFYSGFPRA